VQAVSSELPKEARIGQAVEANVALSVRQLSRVPDLAKSIKSGKICIVGAVYDLHTGKVEFLEMPKPTSGRSKPLP
jgi:carbonic anhydrase